ncbi:WD40 repeat-like protein [Gigaspora margarita]|uniref:WD40 repeat-like protein n=1 Tax=Gigaspora margarita TaxID=4874 RepID=A0A8H4A3D8_GIGMA|nr:WD40 repeat-like protein [Gigaspora margarita]
MKSPRHTLLGKARFFNKIFAKNINEDSKDRAVTRRQLSTLSPTKFHPAEVEDEGFYTVEDSTTKIDFLIKLPYEIAAYILVFVNYQTLCRMSRVSRAWKYISQDNELWRSMYVANKGWKASISREAALAGEVTWKDLYRNRHVLAMRWKKGECEKTYLNGHGDSVYCIQFDEYKIVTGSRDKTIKFWDIKTGECFQTLYGHDLSVLCLQYNDKIMVSGSSDKTIIIWDMQKVGMQKINHPVTQLRRLTGHTAGVLDICFDDFYIVSCSKDSTIKVWDINTGACLRTLTGHRGPVNAVQLHGNRIISASGDALIKLWNLESGEFLKDFIGHTRGLACVQFDGKWVVSGSNDKTIKIWDVETAQCVRTLEGHTDLVRTLHFDEDKIVSGSYDQTVKVWELKTGKQLLDFKEGHTSWVFDVQFSSTKIVSTSQDQKILVMDFADELDTKYIL